MKMLILETCMVNYHDDRGGVPEERGSIVDVTKETARQLAMLDRALYVDKKDDPDKSGRHTADKDLLAAAEKAKKDTGKA